MDSIPQKQCSKCKRTLPATLEYFSPDKKMLLGLRSSCKECQAQAAAERRLKRGQKPYLRPTKEGYKICSKCHRELPATAEHFNKHSGCYLGLKSKCRDCEKSMRATPEFKAMKNAIERKRYANNPEWCEQLKEYGRWFRNTYPEKVKAHSKHYYDGHKEAESVRQHNKRARKRALPIGLTIDQWKNCLEYWEYKCCVCGRRADFWHVITKDHWIPLADNRETNPGTVVENILPMCHSRHGATGDVGCNNSKGSNDSVQWLISIMGKRKANRILKEIESYFEWVKGKPS